MKIIITLFLSLVAFTYADAVSLRRKALVSEAAAEAKRVAAYHKAAAKVKAAEATMKSVLDPWISECAQKNATLQIDSIGDPHCIAIPERPKEQK